MRVVKAYKNVGVSRATSPKRQKKEINDGVPRCRTNASLLTGKVQPERVALRLRDSTLRRESRDEAAGTRCLSRPRRARTGAGRRLASERAAAGRQEGRSGAGSRGTRVANGQQRTRLAAPRWQRPYLRAGGSRRCQAEGGVQPHVRRARAHRSAGAMRARLASRAIGVAGIQACSLRRHRRCDAAGQARESTGEWNRGVAPGARWSSSRRLAQKK